MAVSITWPEYLDLLDDAVRRVETELTVHPGNFEAVLPDIDSAYGAPEGPMPPDLGRAAALIHLRMTSAAALIELQMAEVETQRVSLANEHPGGYIDPTSVYFDAKM